MRPLDWFVLVASLVSIIAYGLYRSGWICLPWRHPAEQLIAKWKAPESRRREDDAPN